MKLNTLWGRLRSITIAALCVIAVTACSEPRILSNTQFPDVVVWAWDAPNDLRFLKSSGETVAIFAGTILLGNETAYFKPNQKPLLLAATQNSFPVFRIESRANVADGAVDAIENDSRASAQIDNILAIIAGHFKQNGRAELVKFQIDFDANASERNFYRVLLKRLRFKFGPQARISVTALASWCLGDRWLPSDYIDEAVVMLFSMGEGQSEILNDLKREQLDAGKGIRLAIGLSVNEARTNAILLKDKNLLRGRHLYLFNSLPWTETCLRRAEKEICAVDQN